MEGPYKIIKKKDQSLFSSLKKFKILKNKCVNNICRYAEKSYLWGFEVRGMGYHEDELYLVLGVQVSKDVMMK